ncbi:MAG: hypothetical protein OXI88_22140 [Gammaproteobacteria bacterium]|nr:hypothetical protein [Gammaproteobacteria bacterium]
MKKDTSVIPIGEYCYRLVKKRDGEILIRDGERFGKDIREYDYKGDYKAILCPYWQTTDYGTVRCDFLDKETISDASDACEKIQAHFGISDASEKFSYDWALADEIKICDINIDEDWEENWPF